MYIPRLSMRAGLMLGACLIAGPAFAQQAVPPGDEAAETDEATQVDDIVVTASTRTQSVIEAPASITVITAAELENRAVADFFDVLRDVEGVSVSGGSNFQDIFIRGLPGNYTLTLVDGRRQSTRDSRTNGTAGFEQLYLPPTGAIERVEVVRGPMSSLYGSDAIGGVVNVITRRGLDRWSGSLAYDYVSQEEGDSGDWRALQAYVSGPIIRDVLGVQLWGRTYDRTEDDILNATAGDESQSFAGRIAWVPAVGHEVLVQADTTEVTRSSSAGRNLAPTGADTYTINTRDALSASWMGDWTWGTSSLSVLQEVAQRETYTRAPAVTGNFVRNVRAPEITNTVYDALFNVPLGQTSFGDHNLVFGGQYITNSLVDVNPGVSPTLRQTFEVWQRALFIEDELRLSPTFAITGGVRWDDHERYGGNWTPRLYAVWNATDALTIKGGVSYGFRAPEIRQVADGYAYTTGGGGCTVGPMGTCGVIIGDPNLEPETSVNYEVSALFNPSRALSLTATAFRTDFADKIDSTRICGPDANTNGICDLSEVVRWSENPNYQLYYWFNLDDARIQGVELTGRWRATDRLTLKGGYTFTDSEQLSGAYAGLPLSRTPEHMGNLRVDYDVNERASVWAAANYHGEEINAQLRSGTNGVLVGVGAARRYPSYSTVDAGAAFQATDNVTLRFAIYNLTDEVLNVRDYDFQGDGRRAWFGLNLEF